MSVFAWCSSEAGSPVITDESTGFGILGCSWSGWRVLFKCTVRFLLKLIVWVCGKMSHVATSDNNAIEF